MREHRAPHQNRDLLDDLHPRVPRLPRLLGLAHGLEEGEERGDPERRRHHRERTRRCVADILVEVVDIRAHRRDHRRQARRLGQVSDDLAALDARVVVLVDEERLDHDQDLVRERPHQIVELVQHAVDNLDEQMALLVLQSRRHEEREDLVEEGPRPELACLVRDLAESLLAHRGGPVLDLEEQLHDPPLVRLVLGHLRLVLLIHKRREELVILRLHERERAVARRHRHVVRLAGLVLRHRVRGRAPGCGGRQKLARGGNCRLVAGRGLQDLVALLGEESVELLVVPRPVPLVDITLEPELVHLLRRHLRQLTRERRLHAHPAHRRSEVPAHRGHPAQRRHPRRRPPHGRHPRRDPPRNRRLIPPRPHRLLVPPAHHRRRPLREPPGRRSLVPPVAAACAAAPAARGGRVPAGGGLATARGGGSAVHRRGVVPCAARHGGRAAIAAAGGRGSAVAQTRSGAARRRAARRRTAVARRRARMLEAPPRRRLRRLGTRR
mmetsp:Transcript_32675/g.77364  ORF Transcript_32675/g.77364 Transcript_32675/m.77364 type:complete len:496 (-) Transcript_32675:571-2058(-)